MHTYPVSKCGEATVRESLEFYRNMGYDGVFLTNHFLDGNINVDAELPYKEKIDFYFSDYEEALSIGSELGIKVFLGVEISYGGTDFLIYGLDKQWYLNHPEIMNMKKSDELPYLMDNGALVIQAHPFREAHYIDHIRLFPRCVHGVESDNATDPDISNTMAKFYAKEYGLREISGSDNHKAGNALRIAGIETETPLVSERDFMERFFRGEYSCFSIKLRD